MIENKVVLITGVSSGIGRETAQLLAERGARLFGTVRDLGRADPIARVELVLMDVTDDKSVKDGAESVLENAGKIDILINNAGYSIAGGLDYTKTKITTNEKTVRAAIPAYAEQRQRVTEIIEKEIANGDDPHAVAEVVYEAVTAKSPRLHYPVGEGVMLSWLNRFVPARMFDSVFRKRFQLDEPAQAEMAKL